MITNTYAICAFAAIGGGLFGFDISSMSGVLGTQAYIRYFHNPRNFRQGGITCAMPAGSFLGAAMSSYIADRWSRKVAIQVGAVIWCIGAILQACSVNVGMLIVGRIIAGVCVGICSSIVPVYQSEVAAKEIRGRVVSLQQWAITWGILIQYFIQYGCSFIDGGANNPSQSTLAFRIPWAVQIVPAVILFIGLFWFPYSPRWLASKDRWEEAKEVLAQLHGGGDVHHPKVVAQYTEIQEAIRFEHEEEISSYAELIKPRVFKRVILGISIQGWSQLTGMNICMYYIVYIMQSIGVDDPLLTSSIQYIINVAMTLPAILFLDRWGRRPVLLAGSFMLMTWLFISGAIQGHYGQPNPDPNGAVSWILVGKKTQGRVVVACSYLFVATFATSWGPVSWTYPSEIYNMRVRTKAVALATMSNWIWNCALAFAVPPLLTSISWKMYFLFGTFNGLAFIHMFLTAHETKGKTLEEMDEVFDSGRPAWKRPPKESRLDRLVEEARQGKLGMDQVEVVQEKI